MRTVGKGLANALALLMVFPAYLLYSMGRLLLGTQRAFPGWSQAFSLLPGHSGAYLRRAFYRLTLAHCGRDCHISFGVIFSHATARVGQHAYLGAFCCLGDVTLEDDVLLGSHVSVANGAAQHGIERLDVPIREQRGDWKRVTIGRDSWIGDRATVLADVGRQCVIGAGAVVTRAIPDRSIAVGVPARVLRQRRQPTHDTALGETQMTELL